MRFDRSRRRGARARKPSRVFRIEPESLESRELLSATVADPNLAAQVARIVEEALHQHVAPGMAVSVVEGGRILLSQGYGLANAKHSIRVTADTPFEIGSVSKTFAAFAALKLYEDPGLITKPGITSLNLDQPITTYLTPNPTPDPEVAQLRISGRWQGVKMRQLLEMSAGLNDQSSRSLAWPNNVDRALHHGLARKHFVPGEDYFYSDASYMMIGAVIQNLTGMPYEQFVTQQIIAPLHLTETVAQAGDSVAAGQATGYNNFDHQTHTWNPTGAYWPGSSAFAASDISTTATDIGLYLQAIQEQTILKPSTMAVMFRPTPLTNVQHHGAKKDVGMGWFDYQLAGDRIVKISKNGVVPGYSAEYAFFPQTDTAVGIALNNSDPSVIQRKVPRVIAEIEQRLG